MPSNNSEETAPYGSGAPSQYANVHGVLLDPVRSYAAEVKDGLPQPRAHLLTLRMSP
jgi:hypothetical protein